MKRLAAIVMGVTLLGLATVGWAAGPGTSGAAVLQIPVGARAIGMGEAYTAQADDASSLYWNPAGLAILNESEASFMYNPFLKDLTYQNASVAVPLENAGLGASLSYLSYGKIQGFDANGDPTGDISAYSGVATVGGAWLGETWSAGANIKGIQESLDGTKANGVAADLGASVVYPQEIKGGTLRAGAVVKNLGKGLKFIDQEDPLPREWRVGLAAVQMMNRKLNLSLDYGKVRDADGAVYAGGEYWVLPFLALRTGYAGSKTEGSGVRAGVGLKFKDLSFDYAFSSYGDLGLAHRYELSFRFGAIQPRLTPEERKLLHRAKLAMAQERYGEATELFDALIQLEPNYRPARRYVTTAMRHYEGQEGVMAKRNDFRYSPSLKPAKAWQNEDPDETRDLEALLKMGDETVAQAAKKSGR